MNWKFLVMVCNYNISFWSFESCEMKWKLVCFSSWSGIVKVLLWGTWSDPKLGCWLFKRRVLSQQPCSSFKPAEGARSGGCYQNIEIPAPRTEGHLGSKYIQPEIKTWSRNSQQDVSESVMMILRNRLLSLSFKMETRTELCVKKFLNHQEKKHIASCM